MKMKTKIIGAFTLLVMAACGSSDKSAQPDQQPVVNQATATKFIFKAANNKYVTVSANNFKLIADQPDAAKAEAFEIIDLGNGKSALKATSNGKFVCDNLSESINPLQADKDHTKEWETFEIIAVDQTKVNFKSITGKFVCANLGAGDFLQATQDHASDWETFTIEAK